MGLAPPPKANVFGVDVSVTDYDHAAAVIIDAATAHRPLGVSALAVHGLMECVKDPELGRQVNSLAIVTPDGQPVRWALNLLHGTALRDRVSGPDLVERVCAEAVRRGVRVYLYGSTEQTASACARTLQRRHPGLQVVGVQPDRFREATAEEDEEDVTRINRSGAGIVLVGRGCPRQERWVAAHQGRVHAAMLAVGAAFDYFAGNIRRAPRWMQRAGLEWTYRLYQEPRRLGRRYLVTNVAFLARLGRELALRRLPRRRRRG
ncbi:MAG TPA: WecB/TagA/CpsF family glycosyltransferase [Egibacteraceae bacterium]|nr:WecB/TagA/CpsF family glycosyltransferase [Egibacteraceae bacterium]